MDSLGNFYFLEVIIFPSIIQVSQGVLQRHLQVLVEPVSLMVFSRCFGHLALVVLSDVCNFCSQSCIKTAHLLCLALCDVEELPHHDIIGCHCAMHGVQHIKDDLQGTCPRLLTISVGTSQGPNDPTSNHSCRVF